MNLFHIYEGWKNHLLPSEKLKEKIEEVSNYRLSICRECPFHSSKHNTMRKDEHCTSCGCPLITKTKSLSSSCPKEKWKEELTEEQNNEIFNSHG